MGIFNIEWLGSCYMCGCESIEVKTEDGTDSWLYSGDKIKCNKCGAEGVVDCDDEIAYASWDDEE